MVINQIHSIGDILFLEKMYSNFFEKDGVPPVVPVRDHLIWLRDYISSASIVPMSKFKIDYEDRNPSNIAGGYLPTRWASQILRGIADDDYSFHEYCMTDKYVLAGMDPLEWTDLSLKFNMDKCIDLKNKIVGDCDDYIVINNHSQAGDLDIKVSSKCEKIIYMDDILGYTLIDWALVMADAKENHHVSTSTFFLMQAIINTFKVRGKFYVYPRPNFDGLRGVSMLKPTYDFQLMYS